jgi:hypothetical protein
MIYAYLIKKLKIIGIEHRESLTEKEEIVLRKIIFSMPIKRFVDNFDEIVRTVK